jgi:hypothetical protein
MVPGEAAYRADYESRLGVPVISLVGAPRATNGQALAIAGWRSVRARAPDARLVIIGDVPEAGDVAAAATAS